MNQMNKRSRSNIPVRGCVLCCTRKQKIKAPVRVQEDKRTHSRRNAHEERETAVPAVGGFGRGVVRLRAGRPAERTNRDHGQPSPSVQASQEAQIQTGGEETLPEEVLETEEESPAVSPEETQSETAETTPASITGKPSEVAIEGLQLKDDVKRGEEYATVTLYDNGEYEYFGMDESVMVGLTVERLLARQDPATAHRGGRRRRGFCRRAGRGVVRAIGRAGGAGRV